ncbi:MAG: C40 family peptidase [Saprospiraceae bacterium]|nr:C40 family peptidase [Saprospiraceae bacterium]
MKYHTMQYSFRSAFLLLFVALLSACSTLKSTPKAGGSSAVSSRRLEITDYAKKFVGVNYKYAGQSPTTGFDCSGFTSYVMRGFGVTISPSSSVQATEGKKIPLDHALPGDLIFFGENEKKIQHVGLVVKRDKDGITCVHSTTSRGVIVENVSTSTYWKPKILFARDVVNR